VSKQFHFRVTAVPQSAINLKLICTSQFEKNIRYRRLPERRFLFQSYLTQADAAKKYTKRG
jgi:hypothetical protein